MRVKYMAHWKNKRFAGCGSINEGQSAFFGSVSGAYII
jgi:hypothetical protein